jgi:hypothetical protein
VLRGGELADGCCIELDFISAIALSIVRDKEDLGFYLLGIHTTVALSNSI